MVTIEPCLLGRFFEFYDALDFFDSGREQTISFPVNHAIVLDRYQAIKFVRKTCVVYGISQERPIAGILSHTVSTENPQQYRGETHFLLSLIRFDAYVQRWVNYMKSVDSSAERWLQNETNDGSFTLAKLRSIVLRHAPCTVARRDYE